MVTQFLVYDRRTKLNSLVNELKSMNPCEGIWTVDMKVMATHSELTQFNPLSQTLLPDTILDPALNSILLKVS